MDPAKKGDKKAETSFVQPRTMNDDISSNQSEDKNENKWYWKMNQLKDFQSLLFSPTLDTQLIQTKITELKSIFPPERIDQQLILHFH